MARHKQTKQKSSVRFTMISSGMGDAVALAPGSEGDPPVTYDEVKDGFGTVKNKLAATSAAAHLTEGQQKTLADAANIRHMLDAKKAQAAERKLEEAYVSAAYDAAMTFTEAASKSASLVAEQNKLLAQAAKLLEQGIVNNTPGFLGPLANPEALKQAAMEYSTVVHPSNVAMGAAFLSHTASIMGPVGEQATPPPSPQPDYLDNMLEDRHRTDALEF